MVLTVITEGSANPIELEIAVAKLIGIKAKKPKRIMKLLKI